ncbi:hypothetical protein QFW96_29380 [Saccharopolyspora sp. TS4A08]|uniref:Uncharacterized protein n=1 Tax=Saccharopolyspora ipomoeae TaxID=3042027 RepID=A0ABT6PXM3_9PSEU|nr:hypothetical protein [Saccharopolyspora sp. TS4A08]MDI2032765.1 hypothetical protein [Saccharopolyspora sp. TS4A08]
MQSNSRTIVSVVGTVSMVVLTVLLAVSNAPNQPTEIHPAANQTPIVAEAQR